MFDFSWSELLLIGVVALVFIGPKELPGVLRTLGQWMSKIRRMAGEFQNQFHDAMREAELSDLKREVDEMRSSYSKFDPLADVRKNMEMAQREIETAVAGTAAEHLVTPQSSVTGATAPEPGQAVADVNAPVASAPIVDAPIVDAPMVETSAAAADAPASEAVEPAKPVAAGGEPA